MILRVKVRGDRVVASFLFLGQLPPVLTELLRPLLFRHCLHRLFRLTAPDVKLLHVIITVTVVLLHSSLKDSVRFPTVDAAVPSKRMPFAIDCLLDSFLRAALEDLDALLFLCLFAIRFE